MSLKSKWISHRGNINGRNLSKENDPAWIRELLWDQCDEIMGVEVDLWCFGESYYLGHDYAQYPINKYWLMDWRSKLWIHAKNLDALQNLIKLDKEAVRIKLNYFFHDKDDYTLVANSNLIWANIDRPVNENTIIVMKDDQLPPTNCYGFCSDWMPNI